MTYRAELRRQNGDGSMIVFPRQYDGHATVEDAVSVAVEHARCYALTHDTEVLLRVYGEEAQIVFGTYIRPRLAGCI